MNKNEDEPAWGDGHPHDGKVPQDGSDSWEFDAAEFFANGSSVLPPGEGKKPKVTLPPDD